MSVATASGRTSVSVRTCLDCPTSLEGTHGLRKRCEPCSVAAERVRLRDTMRRRYRENPAVREAARDYRRRRRQDPAVREAERQRKQTPEYVEVQRDSSARYRARKFGAECDDHTAAERLASWEERGLYGCVFHGPQCTGEYETLEHLVPFDRGGSHTIGNVAPSCASCNSSKHTRTAAEYVADLLAASTI